MGVPAKKLDFDEIVKNLDKLTPGEVDDTTAHGL